MPWGGFRSAVDAMFRGGHGFGAEMRHLRSEAGAVGDSLGHWDITAEGGQLRVSIAPPFLARLPWPGSPRAVLCGARSPDTASDVDRACRSLGGASLRAAPQHRIHAYAPSRIEVASGTEADLAAVAARLGVAYADEAPAWRIAAACGTVAEYLASLDWQPDDNLEWQRRDFDPIRLAFGQPRSGGAGLRLSSYEHPRGWTRLDRLVRGGEMAAVGRSWGRYAVLASAKVRVVRYDERAGAVTGPRQVPFPTIIARALGLCSGRPPTVVPGLGLGELVYSGVPRAVFDVIDAKLGQQCGGAGDCP